MQINVSEDMQEILEEFIQEAEELLENLDQELIELENDPTNKELLNQIFRGMHTLKGGAGFLGLESIINLAHVIESIFDKLRNDEMQLDSNKMDIILEGIDILKNSIETLKASHEIPDNEDIADILQKLHDLLEGKEPSAEEQHEQKSETAPQEPAGQESGEMEILFKEDVDPAVAELIRKYPNKNMAEILDELILLPPEERDMDLIMKLDELISAGKDVEDLIEKRVKASPKPAAAEQPQESPAKSQSAPEPAAKPAQTPAPSKPGSGAKKKKEENETIRIDIDRVSTLMNLVGELVLDRNRIVKLTSRFRSNCADLEAIEELNEAIAGMSRSVSDLQEVVMKLRMQPVKRIFSKFPRIVRDLAKKVGKKINLELEGEDTEIDRSILNQLEDPLIHLVRNSIDHGIEPPEERIAKGKPEYGTIVLSALQEGDRIIVSIEDDEPITPLCYPVDRKIIYSAKTISKD